jgi:hypothetical protein
VKDHEIAAFVNRLVKTVTDTGITQQLRAAIRAEVLNTLVPIDAPPAWSCDHEARGGARCAEWCRSPNHCTATIKLIPGYVTERSSAAGDLLGDTTLE